MSFLNKYNDYSCIQRKDKGQHLTLYHYTSSVDAVKNIVTGCFWYTDMADFKFEDKNEGYLILNELKEWIGNEYAGNSLISSVVSKNIGNEMLMESFICNHKSFVLSMCTNSNSLYMWENYACGNGYKIIIDKEQFINSLRFVVQGGKIRIKVFKHAPITYDKNEQYAILKQEFEGIRNEQEFGLSQEDILRYGIEHLMYIGNFFKAEDPYKEEEEYRVLINTLNYDETINHLLPECLYNPDNKKHYIKVYFDSNSIKGIECQNEGAYNAIKESVDKKLLLIHE